MKLTWPILAVVAVVCYAIYVSLRRKAAAAEIRAGQAANMAAADNDPLRAVKDAAGSMISRADQLVAAIRADPGRAGLLGLSAIDVDRILLSNEGFSKIYRKAFGGNTPYGTDYDTITR